MTKTEVQHLMIKINERLNKNVDTYKDFLAIQEGLIGEKSPLITKFRNVICSFNNDSNKVIKAIFDDLRLYYT